MTERTRESNKKVTGKVFDYRLFSRLMKYARHYRPQFILSVVSVILIAVFAAIRPILLKDIIDEYIFSKNAGQVLLFTVYMLLVLLLEVFFQFLVNFSLLPKHIC